MLLVLATKNQGKIREIEKILERPGLEFRSLRDYPDIPEVQEDGQTFLDNALKKAELTALATGEMTLADDSGLVVEILAGAPGVYSARFAGEGATDAANNQKLLSLLEGVPEEGRKARFVCTMVLFAPDGAWKQAEGTCPGIITREPRGDQGFGYDPVFFVPNYQKTMAEIPLEEKNRISHRAQALRKVRSHLEALAGTARRPGAVPGLNSRKSV